MSFGSGDAKYVITSGYATSGGYYTEVLVQLQYNNGGVTVRNTSFGGGITIPAIDNDYLTYDPSASKATNISITVTAKHDCTVYTAASAVATNIDAGDSETFNLGDPRNSYIGLAIVFYD